MFRKNFHPITLLSLFLFALLHSQTPAQQSETDELEKQVQTIVDKLKKHEPAKLDRSDPAASNLIKQLVNIGPEARAALPLLEKFASMENPVGFRGAAIEYSVRTLEGMGDEGVPTLKKLLKTSRGETLYTILSELNNSTYLDYAPLLPELQMIANWDETRPSDKVIQAEIAAFKKSNPEVDLENGFLDTSGSKSLDEFREQEDKAFVAMDIILNSRDTWPLATDFFVKRIAREKNPSFDGIGRFAGNAKIIAALKKVAISSTERDRKIAAASRLSEVDSSGKTAIPTLLGMLADKSNSDAATIQQITRQIRRNSATRTYDQAAILAAIGKAPESEREKIKQQLFPPKPDIEKQRKQLNEQFQKLKKEDKRKALKVAGQLIRIAPDNKEVIDFMLEIVDDTTLPSTLRDPGGFSRPPGKFHLRPMAARDLASAGPKHHKRILKSLKERMTEISVTPGYTRLTDLAKTAAWTAAQLDRKDPSLVEFVNSRFFPFSSSNIKSPFYGQSGKFVAEVFGDRLEPFAGQLVMKSLQYDRGTGDANFARQILFNTKPIKTKENAEPSNPFIEMLVKRAFKKITGEIVDTKRSIISEYGDRAISINFLFDNSHKLRPAFDTILEYTGSPNYEARKTAVHLIGEMQNDPESSILVLIASCNDERALVRAFAAKALAKFGPSAKPALSQLRSMQSDRYESVKTAARDAIKTIEQ